MNCQRTCKSNSIYNNFYQVFHASQNIKSKLFRFTNNTPSTYKVYTIVSFNICMYILQPEYSSFHKNACWYNYSIPKWIWLHENPWFCTNTRAGVTGKLKKKRFVQFKSDKVPVIENIDQYVLLFVPHCRWNVHKFPYLQFCITFRKENPLFTCTCIMIEA